ncbi:MAG: hypothetical protein A3C03_00030 [Candidatus Colwellbacteria bacterium RIFCSPHIGHO2_02_FULL_45_17]|uniref:Uncharacterized protein n=2 Tax=Parcubacteria group TaxID=1794811 RepID=A0A0H4T7K7_9BACT|nr:hypothetical protein [uncultured Parcubacteria bacterium Rifle_16ft_4_minimus_37647]OGY57747.1 MAG: hypothetical protein A3C03_00030 [Candidatus Colwellbacteria bacterium RIFCSPHIGHO2_02_FULL_45_17]OGY62604.1 MAG: hypothetical protein A3G58_01035 [Candidatus Colwellbacteria bacterium RIFCSPLOWO2_12_FULL_46_17]
MLRNKLIVLMFGGGVLLLVASALIGLVGLPQEPGGSLIIRFDPVKNEAGLLGGSGTFFGLLGTVAFIIILNFVLALEVYNREKFLSYAIGAVTLLITLLFLVASVNIAGIN